MLVYKSVPVFSIPAFTKCLNLAARYKTLLRDTVGTSDYMDPNWPGAGGAQLEFCKSALNIPKV